MAVANSKHRRITFLSLLAILCLLGHLWFLLSITTFESQIDAKARAWIRSAPECVQNGGDSICETDLDNVFFVIGIFFGIYVLTIIISIFTFDKLRRRKVSISYWQFASIIVGLLTTIYLALWLIF
jgi:hypothetical protein